jgi:energy-coupling factor transporter ATP-binding protein EcfA2
VVEAAQAVAQERVRDSSELFDELNGEILTLGQRFGISGLTKVKLNRAAHLPVTKEGTNYNFGGLSDGDKLRLKVAVVIALLRVGRRYGAGRHPGLLFVDSPGAEEVATGSLNQMISGLVEVSGDLGLQVVVSTARLSEVAQVLPADRLRTPPEGQATLW